LSYRLYLYWLDKHYSDSASGKSTVEKRFAKFKRGEIYIEGDALSRRRKGAVTDQNIKKIHKINLNDRKVKMIEIAETLKISKKRVEYIVHEYLYMRKLCAKCVPRVLTIDQKQRSNVYRYSTVIKMNFSVDILQWM
jgi:hypothetical protein